jgi:hypothetical protein
VGGELHFSATCLHELGLALNPVVAGISLWKFPSIYPVRNNAPLFYSAAIAELDFRVIPAGFNAPSEFLTRLTLRE